METEKAKNQKKAYRSPRLWRYGTIKALTKATRLGGKWDNETHPNKRWTR